MTGPGAVRPRWKRRLAAGPRERGSMALEMVILAPLLLLLLMFLLACGRYFQTSSLLEAAAKDGARAATQARSRGDAQVQVDDAVDRTMQQAIDSCKNTADGVIQGDFTAGSPISVEVSCTVNYGDLGLIGFDLKEVTLKRKFTSTLDPYRGVRDAP